jgi:hypothetical protein
MYKNKSPYFISLLVSNGSEQVIRDKRSYKLQFTTESIVCVCVCVCVCVYSFRILSKSSSSERLWQYTDVRL